MGETRRRGPCSEIYYDFGPEAAERVASTSSFRKRPGGGRFTEIWNLVFMQYDRDAQGILMPLPRPVQHGTALERTAAVLQGKLSDTTT